MELKTYLKKFGVSQDKFARELGVSQGLVWQWLEGKTTITAKRARDIEDATAGAVTRYDLRPDVFGETSMKCPPAREEAA